MMESKISLSLFIQGANRLSSQECEENPKNSYNEHNVTINYLQGKSKKQKMTKETLSIKTRKNKLVKQVINLTKEAYDYMLESSPNSKQCSTKQYHKLPYDQRLKMHFDLIANDLKAHHYTYQILED